MRFQVACTEGSSDQAALAFQRNALLAERDTLLKAQEATSDLAAQKVASEQHADELLVANAQLSQALKHVNGLPIPLGKSSAGAAWSAATPRIFSAPQRAC